MLAQWVNDGLASIIDDEIRFWNGSKIYLCHCKDEKDRFRYQGAEMHVLLIDELTHFTEVIYRYLRGRVRMVGIKVPSEYEFTLPRILCSSNPGGIGHQWVKSTFIDGIEPMQIRRMGDEDGGMLRQFIPALLEDNPSMASDDPTYRARLRGLGSETLVRAMEHGDWDIVEGAFFDCWRSDRHVIKPFQIPREWMRFRSMDWGSAKPFSVGWWAVVSDDYRIGQLVLPRGCLVRYREWYGASKANTGLKLTAQEVGKGIADREAEDDIAYGTLDPAAFAEDGGPSIAENMRVGSGGKIIFKPADNKRVAQRGAMGGWDAMRQRLVGEDVQRPMIVCFSTCLDSIRTIPSLQHDMDRPEDLDTDGEDHCFVAGTMVDTNLGQVAIEQLVPGKHAIWSAGKWRWNYYPRMTRLEAEIVCLKFDSERVVYCTPNHLFMDCSGEWRYASDLANREVACDQSLSAKQFKSLTAFGITYAATIFRNVVSAFTGWFGNGTTERFQKLRTYTIKMAIARITSPITSNASPSQITLELNTVPKAASVQSILSERQSLLLRSGMGAKLGEIGTESITKNALGRGFCRKSLQIVTNAASHIWLRFIAERKASSVAVLVKPVRCVSVEKAGRAPVYCLTEPVTSAFTIEGGFIVHNCADEWRYACMSRPWVNDTAASKQPRDKWDRVFNMDNNDEADWRTA